MTGQALIHLLRGLAWVAEHFPDDPQLANKLLVGGSLLFLTFLWPATSSDRSIPIAFLQIASGIAGGICLFLGAFVYFRRGVWAWQDKRGAGIVELKLGEPYRAPKKSIFEE